MLIWRLSRVSHRQYKSSFSITIYKHFYCIQERSLIAMNDESKLVYSFYFEEMPSNAFAFDRNFASDVD